MIMKKGSRRFVSVVLLVVLLVTSFASVPSVFAEETGGSDEQVKEEVLETQDAAGDAEAAEENAAAEEMQEPEVFEEKAPALQSSADSEHAQSMTLDTNAEDLKLTISAESLTRKLYKKTNEKYKVKFTAKWSDADKVKRMEEGGWIFKYSLRDQDGKKLKEFDSVKKGVSYLVDKNTEYKIRATVYKEDSKGNKTKNPYSPYETKSIGKLKFPAKPKDLKAKCKSTSNDVRLSWDEVKGAKGYYIYRSSSKKIPSKPFEFVKDNSYKDKNRSGKKTYRYYVQTVYPKRKSHGFSYQTASYLTSAAKVTVNKFVTQPIRSIKWVKKLSGGAAILYDKATGNASHGKLKSGVKVEVLKKYPKRIPRGGRATRIYVKWTNGNKVKKGWIAYRKHVKGRVIAQVAYSKGKALDWTKERKEEYVNKKGYKSKTKYLIWVSTYTQRANVFKGKKGHWKLIKSSRVVSGEFLWWTKRGDNFRIWKHSPRRIRYFVGSTTRKYWYHHLSHFQGGNAFHTVCWLYPGKSKQVNFIKANLQPGTKGCLRMHTPDAIWIYNTIPLDTRVVIY
ncbi:MAG: L,D-transpeptidase family protein [Eubacterium sp.]|nr:L,D-transpeptidase family protein [Eubacterium sp.]